MSRVKKLFEKFLAANTSLKERIDAYNAIMLIADGRQNEEYSQANLLLGHFYAGYYVNPIPQHCSVPNVFLSEQRYLKVLQVFPDALEASIGLAHAYCRSIFTAYLLNNKAHAEKLLEKLIIHLCEIRSRYLKDKRCGNDTFEILQNVLLSKNCESLQLSQYKSNLILLLTANYYLMADHIDYEMAKKCLIQFRPVIDDSKHSELLINILEKIGFYDSRLSEHLGQYVKNICGIYIRTLLPPQILIKKAQACQKENKSELAYWYINLAAISLENDFYKSHTDSLDKKNEIIAKLKEAVVLLPEVHDIKHILKRILGLKSIDQLHELLISENPLSLPLHKAILSESIARYLKANSSQQDMAIVLIYKNLINAKSLFTGKNIVDIFTEMSIDIQRYQLQPIHNDIYLVWLALAKHLIQQGAEQKKHVFNCFKRCLELRNVDYKGIFNTLEQNRKSFIQKNSDEFVHLLVQIALQAFDPATGKNLDIKYQSINIILELKTTEELMALCEESKQKFRNKEELWYAEVAIRGLCKIKLPKSDGRRLEIFKKIEFIAKQYPMSPYMNDKLQWARNEISKNAMIKSTTQAAKSVAENDSLNNKPTTILKVTDEPSTLKIAQR